MLEQTQKIRHIDDFASAEEALEAIENLEDSSDFPSLIFLDLNMPGLNGIEFVRALYQHKKLEKRPVIVLLLNSILLKKQEEEAFAAGIDFLKNKPLEEKDMLEILEHVIVNQ